ncbi:hypothetical protein C2S51_004262 [Perilla frutescens var. frutescens]|nr:hypothetical protein C2S51_004262 [Perilla frutescens var. frutescens]
MENSKPLATESFSYSWLVDRKQQSLDVLTEIIRPTLHEKDQNFNFDVSLTAFHAALVHADEIFSDGHIRPVYVDRSKVEALKTSSSVPPSPVSSYTMGNTFDTSKKQWCLVERWRRSSKRILQKCFGLMRPLYQTKGCSRKSSRVDDLERKVCEVRSWSNSLQASPRPSSAVDWPDFKKISNGAALKKAKSWAASPQASPRISPSRASSAWCGDESSIHEAILYCKRSIGRKSIADS